MNPNNISVAGFARAGRVRVCVGRATIVAACLAALFLATAPRAFAQPDITSRIRGLIVGSILGDAAGGPLEFQEPVRSSWTADDVVLTDNGIKALAERFELRSYTLRPTPESYGQWSQNAPAGTVTDDTRFKILFMRTYRAVGSIDRPAFAGELLAWHADTLGRYGNLPKDWLDEFAYAARWVLGDRDLKTARPPERQWGGISTMAGQMPYLLAATLAPGHPQKTYEMVWEADFLDNGVGRDQTAALAAGLSAALVSNRGWPDFIHAVRNTDPYGFGSVPWVDRRVERWIDRARQFVREAEGRPYRLFKILEVELGAETWWESWVPMTIVLACAEMARYNPLATMELILEFGHDTDSSLQLAGAIIGAVYGDSVFPETMRETVVQRLETDYSESVDDWVLDLMAPRK